MLSLSDQRHLIAQITWEGGVGRKEINFRIFFFFVIVLIEMLCNFEKSMTMATINFFIFVLLYKNEDIFNILQDSKKNILYKIYLIRCSIGQNESKIVSCMQMI